MAELSEGRIVTIVVSSLGELNKKLIELEIRIPKEHRDRSLLLEIASLKKILEEWPVLDREKAHLLHTCMRMSVIKLQSCELELEEHLKKIDSQTSCESTQSIFWLIRLASDMLRYRKEIRKQISELNKLSGGIGKASAVSPDAEVVLIKES